MKKTINLVALIVMLSVNVLTPISYAQEAPEVMEETHQIVSEEEQESGEEGGEESASQVVEDGFLLVEEDPVTVEDQPEIISEDTTPSLINMVEEVVSDFTQENIIAEEDIKAEENTETDNEDSGEMETDSIKLDIPVEEIRTVSEVEPGMVGVTKNPNAGVTYTDTNGRVFTDIGTITLSDGSDSITMLDRNLGATVAGTGEIVEEECDMESLSISNITIADITIDADNDPYGYHFQWGNNYGFPNNGEVKTSTTFADTSNNAWNNPYVSSTFITDRNRSNNGDWSRDHNENLRGGAGDYDNNRGDSSADYKRQGPCPAGYHVPSQAEWDKLLTMYYNLNPEEEDSVAESLDFIVESLNGGDDGHYVSNSTFSTNFRDAFNLPFAGYRSLEVGFVYRMGYYGYLWSSSAYDGQSPYSRGLIFIATNVNAYNDNNRGYAQSVRCFQDSPLDVSGTQPLTLVYETNGGSVIQSQTIPAGENAYLPGYTTHRDGKVLLGWFDKNMTQQYDLELGDPTDNFTMSADMADVNGVVKVYAKWGDCPEGTRAVDNKCVSVPGVISISDPNDSAKGFTIMDRNLGADEIGDYGYHFQRGNNHGFLPCTDGNDEACSSFPGGESTSDTQVDASGYGPDNRYDDDTFIKNWQWDSSNNENLRGGAGDYNYDNWDSGNDRSERQGPCPEGFHVPSIGERNQLLNYRVDTYNEQSDNDIELQGDSLNYFEGSQVYKFAKYFDIPFAGLRYAYDASVFNMGYYANLWSSSPSSASSPNSRSLYLAVDGHLYMYYDDRALGLSVRCFSDFYQPDTQPFTLRFHTNNGESDITHSVRADHKLITIEKPQRENSVFEGWYKTSDFADGSEFDINRTITSSMDLYAKWSCTDGYELSADGQSCDLVSVTFDANGGKFTNGDTQYVVDPEVSTEDGFSISHTPNVDDEGNMLGNIDMSDMDEIDRDVIRSDLRPFEGWWSDGKNKRYTKVDEIEVNNGTLSGVIMNSGGFGLYPSLQDAWDDINWLDEDVCDFVDGDNFTRFTCEDLEMDKVVICFNAYPSNYERQDDEPREVKASIQSIGDDWEYPGYYIVSPWVENRVAYADDAFDDIDEPTRAGYSFKGWYTQDGEVFNPADVTVDSSIVVHAEWTKDSNSNGSTTPSYSGGGGGGKRIVKTDTAEHNVADEKDSTQNETKGTENNSKTPMDSSVNASEGQAEKLDMSQYNATYTLEQNTAYQFAKSRGITTTSSIKEAKMNTPLTRIQMAKMLSYYAINVLGQTPDETRINKFNDITDKLDAEYDNGVTLAYQLGIMGINMPNNNFRPNDIVTRAEFATALSRMLYDDVPDGKNAKYYEPHMAKLYNEGVINDTNPKMIELRGNVMIMLMRSAKSE